MAERPRVPPSDLDAEAAVLSACLLSQSALDEVRQVLEQKDFYAERNQQIWAAMLELDRQGVRADAVTVAAQLRERRQLELAGGNAYLAQVLDATPAVAHAAEHARIVAGKAQQRRVIEVCERFAAEGYGQPGDVERWAQDAAYALERVATAQSTRAEAELLSELLPRMATELGRRGREGVSAGVGTGWMDLTRKLGGWRRGKLYIAAGRPGMGKSAFLTAAAMQVAEQGLGALLFSAEMDRDELGERVLAVEAGLNCQHVGAGKLGADQWRELSRAVRDASPRPMAVAHQPGARIGDIRAAVRRVQRTFRQRGVAELGLVVVDYLQLLDGERASGESREHEVSTLSKRLAWLAGEFNVPVLCASQLNRQVETRPNKRPQLSDLRESGAIEQDAYAVLFLYRDEYYRGKESQHPGELEVNVAKHRSGPTGRVWLRFDGASTRISDLAPDYWAGRDEAAE